MYVHMHRNAEAGDDSGEGSGNQVQWIGTSFSSTDPNESARHFHLTYRKMAIEMNWISFPESISTLLI